DYGTASDLGSVQDDGRDTDKTVVFDGAAMQHRLMAHRDAFANDQRKKAGIAVQSGVVLNVRFVSNRDGIHIAADGAVRPHAGALPDGYVSDDLRAFVNVRGSGDCGQSAAIRANHAVN